MSYFDVKRRAIMQSMVSQLKTTVEGEPPFTITGSVGKNAIDYKIYGNSVQDGTPTPDSPIEVQSLGELQDDGTYKISITTQSSSSDTNTIDIYLAEPLRKIGNYADYIDLKNKKVVRNIDCVVLDGITTYKKFTSFESSNNNRGYLSLGSNKYKSIIYRTSQCLSNYFSYNKNVYIGANDEIGMLKLNANTMLFRYGSSSNINTKDLANQWLQDNNVYLYLILDTPTEENITLPLLPLFKGTNIISSENTTAPSKINIKYFGG